MLKFLEEQNNLIIYPLNLFCFIPLNLGDK